MSEYRPNIKQVQDLLKLVDFVTNAEAVKEELAKYKALLEEYDVKKAELARMVDVDAYEQQLIEWGKELEVKEGLVAQLKQEAKDEAKQVVAEAKKKANELIKQDNAKLKEIEDKMKALIAKEKELTHANNVIESQKAELAAKLNDAARKQEEAKSNLARVKSVLGDML